MASTWDAMNGVEIFGEPAQEVQDIDGNLTVKYKGKEYTQADRINFGLSGLGAINAWSGSGDPIPWTFSEDVSTPTKVLQVTIPSWIAPYLLISQVKIGPYDLLDGQPICADVWTEVSRNAGVNWPTADTSQAIKFSGLSYATTSLAVRQPRITFRVIRLR